MGSHVKLGNMVNSAEKPPPSRPGKPLAEYLRRVRAAERSRDVGEAFSVPEKLYRASEVARHFNLTRQTVHNYATIGLITERDRTPGGQRLFDESVFRRLHQIQRMKGRHRLHEIRRLLDLQDASPADAALQPVDALPDAATSDPDQEAGHDPYHER